MKTGIKFIENTFNRIGDFLEIIAILIVGICAVIIGAAAVAIPYAAIAAVFWITYKLIV